MQKLERRMGRKKKDLVILFSFNPSFSSTTFCRGRVLWYVATPFVRHESNVLDTLEMWFSRGSRPWSRNAFSPAGAKEFLASLMERNKQWQWR
jgi:hypothetical protein